VFEQRHSGTNETLLISHLLFQIQKLMHEVEQLHQKCAITASNQNSLTLEHEGQMATLQAELEEKFGLQLVQIKEELR
jgi:hypothetical protein